VAGDGFITKWLAAAEYGGGILKSRAEWLNIAQNAEALEGLRQLLDVFVHRPLYMYNIFITFTKVAAF
jgi:hypothetical protein